MNIKPNDKSIKELLDSGYYKIPRFQRPYSWDRGNVDEFWQDAVISRETKGKSEVDYFIGSFVFWRDPKDNQLLYIVDGQQRLTTITILFAAMRNIFDSISENTLAKGIHQLIERLDIDNVPQYVVQTDTSYPYLQEYIQKHGPPELDPIIGSEELALKSAYEFLTEKLNDKLDSISKDPTIADVKKPEYIKNSLLEIRDRLLKLKLIVIELDSEDDAYLVFETLNTRGKDLTVSDLVKNHITKYSPKKNKGVDPVKDKWISIQRRFDEADIDININQFILYSWISQFPYTSSKKLFKEIKKEIRSRDRIREYLDDLVDDSKLYRRLLEPKALTWKNQEKELKESILALNIFRVAQPLPMMLSAIREFYKKRLTLKQTIKCFKVLEKFHFQFTAVTSQRIGGGTARLYASSAHQLFHAENKDEKNLALTEFYKKLKDRRPSQDEFVASFKELSFISTQTRQKSLIKYILTKLDMYWRRNDSSINYDNLTIEHIAPQSNNDAWNIEDVSIGRIGNLVLVTEDLNIKLADKTFQKKIDILKKSSVPMDDFLMNCKEWTTESIEKRTSSLADVAYQSIFHY